VCGWHFACSSVLLTALGLGYNCGWLHRLLGDALDAMRKGTQVQITGLVSACGPLISVNTDENCNLQRTLMYCHLL
jgi:hypothetical protein